MSSELSRILFIQRFISMYIKTYNKSLSEQSRKALQFAFVKQINPGDDETFFCNDTDSVKYRVIAKSKIVILYFFTADTKTVWNYCNQHFKNKYYKFFKVKLSHVNNEDAVQIVLDQEGLTAWNQNYVAKQQTGITTGKKRFDALFDYLSKKMGSVKRHFFASPIQIMLLAIHQNIKNKGSKVVPNLCYNTKPGSAQRVWLIFEKNQMHYYYGISFEDKFEQQLCRVILSEMTDAKKHVKNAPGVGLMDSDALKSLADSFPEQKSKKYSFSNGILIITITGTQVSKPENTATYLAGLRNYVYYHIQAQKCYLHSRVLNRIQTVQRNLNYTKIKPFALN